MRIRYKALNEEHPGVANRTEDQRIDLFLVDLDVVGTLTPIDITLQSVDQSELLAATLGGTAEAFKAFRPKEDERLFYIIFSIRKGVHYETI